MKNLKKNYKKMLKIEFMHHGEIIKVFKNKKIIMQLIIFFSNKRC